MSMTVATFKIVIAECQRLKLAASTDVWNIPRQAVLAGKQGFQRAP